MFRPRREDHAQSPRASEPARGWLNMKLHPLRECAKRADELIGKYGCEVFQQFNCAHCGAKQTIEDANTFYQTAHCERCGKMTNIEADGCNYAVHFFGRK